MWKTLFATAALLAVAGTTLSGEAPASFEEPVKLTAGGDVIDVSIGHADPFVVDLNRDGRPDLLVGQFGQGKLLFFANTAESGSPRLARGEFLRSGEVELSVPSG